MVVFDKRGGAAARWDEEEQGGRNGEQTSFRSCWELKAKGRRFLPDRLIFGVSFYQSKEKGGDEDDEDDSFVLLAKGSNDGIDPRSENSARHFGSDNPLLNQPLIIEGNGHQQQPILDLFRLIWKTSR